MISPDGRTLAFTARYEGPTELYTMPLTGGVPTRWTYEADPSTATTWTPDGKLVYTTRRYSGVPKAMMVQLDIEYAKRRSFWLDISILLRTIPAILSRDGAW